MFFEILESGEINLLIIEGSPTNEELAEAWGKLVDLYFEGKEDAKMNLILRKQSSIMYKSYKIEMYQLFLNLLFSNPFTNKQLIEIIDSLASVGLRINKRKSLNDEIQRVLKRQIPVIKMQLDIEKNDLRELTKGKKLKFYDALAVMVKAGGIPLNTDITLGFYLAYEKQLRK